MDIDTFISGGTLLGQNIIVLVSRTLSVIVGLWLIYSALKSLYKSSMGQHIALQPENAPGTVVVKFICGAIFLSFAYYVNELEITMFGSGIQDYRQTMSYTPLKNINNGVYQKVMELVLLWVVVISVCAIFRGIGLYVKASQTGDQGGQGGSVVWKANWHVLGGAIGVNLPGFIKALFG